mgnify:CR=1 FL=1
MPDQDGPAVLADPPQYALRYLGEGAKIEGINASGTTVVMVTHDLDEAIYLADRILVLDQGRTWLDRAFVVNDWYISAYEPIIDVNGRRVGMLYAGFLGDAERAKVHLRATIDAAPDHPRARQARMVLDRLP